VLERASCVLLGSSMFFFEVRFEVFFVFRGSDVGWVEVSETKSFSTRKRGHYLLHIIVQYQYPPPS